MTVPCRNSAGALPWRIRANNTLEVLLAHRRKHNDWAILKGNVELGESGKACARREVHEETGLDCRLGWELPSLDYIDRKFRPKTAHYWAATLTAGEFTANAEIDEVRWFSVPAAIRTLTKPRERAIPLALGALVHAELGLPAVSARERMLLLIRGASATPRENWQHPDQTRPLADKGKQTARSLVALASLFEVERVLSAPAARCVDTVAPLAHRQSLDVEVSHHLTDGRVEDTMALIDEARGTGTVLCTHEDVVAGALRRLADRDRTKLDAHFGGRRGSAWVLTGDDSRFTSAYYLPMPETRLHTHAVHPAPQSFSPRATSSALDHSDTDVGAA
jgi:8-oxo-dGTP diphosphatase